MNICFPKPKLDCQQNTSNFVHFLVKYSESLMKLLIPCSIFGFIFMKCMPVSVRV